MFFSTWAFWVNPGSQAAVCSVQPMKLNMHHVFWVPQKSSSTLVSFLTPRPTTTVSLPPPSSCPLLLFLYLCTLKLQIFHAFFGHSTMKSTTLIYCVLIYNKRQHENSLVIKISFSLLRWSPSLTSWNQWGLNVYIMLSWFCPHWAKAKNTQVIHKKGSVIS